MGSSRMRLGRLSLFAGQLGRTNHPSSTHSYTRPSRSPARCPPRTAEAHAHTHLCAGVHGSVICDSRHLCQRVTGYTGGHGHAEERSAGGQECSRPRRKHTRFLIPCERSFRKGRLGPRSMSSHPEQAWGARGVGGRDGKGTGEASQGRGRGHDLDCSDGFCHNSPARTSRVCVVPSRPLSRSDAAGKGSCCGRKEGLPGDRGDGTCAAESVGAVAAVPSAGTSQVEPLTEGSPCLTKAPGWTLASDGHLVTSR